MIDGAYGHVRILVEQKIRLGDYTSANALLADELSLLGGGLDTGSTAGEQPPEIVGEFTWIHYLFGRVALQAAEVSGEPSLQHLYRNLAVHIGDVLVTTSEGQAAQLSRTDIDNKTTDTR